MTNLHDPLFPPTGTRVARVLIIRLLFVEVKVLVTGVLGASSNVFHSAGVECWSQLTFASMVSTELGLSAGAIFHTSLVLASSTSPL